MIYKEGQRPAKAKPVNTVKLSETLVCRVTFKQREKVAVKENKAAQTCATWKQIEEEIIQKKKPTADS